MTYFDFVNQDEGMGGDEGASTEPTGDAGTEEAPADAPAGDSPSEGESL